MVDREKVIKGFTCCHIDASCAFCPYSDSNTCIEDLYKDILELLKEQQETIASFQSTICKLNAALGKQPEIVRCGKCTHGHLVSSGFCVCDKYGNAHYHDWFCADGERR